MVSTKNPVEGYFLGVIASVWAIAAVLVFAYCASCVMG